MKRFLVLLVVLAGGLAAAAFTVPSNAATVNGTTISQQDLNSDVTAIANSTYYQCYLNSQEYLSSEGEQELPPVLGAGTGQYAGDHPTATSAFVASYLETDIGHQLLLQAAAEHHVSVTETDLASARSNLTEQISEVMSEILQTQQAQNVRYSCSLTGQALTGEQVVSTLPASFVDAQVQFVAEATALQEDLAGVGSSEADLQNYFAAHGAQFDTACLSAAVYSSQSAAEAGALEVARRYPVRHGGGSDERQRWRGARLRHPLGPRDQVAGGRRPEEPGDRRRLGAHRRQRNVRVAADHVTHADALQQGEGRRGERRAAGGLDGDPEVADRRRAPILGECEPAVRGLGAGERVGPHSVRARAVRRAQPLGQRPRRAGPGAGFRLVGRWSGLVFHGYGYDGNG